MPRLGRLHGRSETTVIPRDWSTSHRPVLDGTRQCPVSLFHPGSDDELTWDEDLEQMVPNTEAAYWTGLARVQALGGGAGVDVVGDAVSVAGYQVTLPDATTEGDPLTTLAVGDRAVVDPTWDGDPLLAGKALQVTEIVRGSLRFERVVLTQLVDDVKG